MGRFQGMSLLELRECFGRTYTPCLTCGKALYWSNCAIRVEAEELILKCENCGHGTATRIPKTLPPDAAITVFYTDKHSRPRDMSEGAAILTYGQVRRALLDLGGEQR